MEFPMIPTACAACGARTSMVLMEYQCGVDADPARSAAVVLSPATMYELVRDPTWPVMLDDVAPYRMVIATRMLGVRRKAMGSDVTDAPDASEAEAFPANESAFRVVASILFPPLDTAMFTAFSSVAWVLLTLVNFKRRVSPPIETRTTWRRVLLVSPGEGGMLADSTR